MRVVSTPRLAPYHSGSAITSPISGSWHSPVWVWPSRQLKYKRFSSLYLFWHFFLLYLSFVTLLKTRTTLVHPSEVGEVAFQWQRSFCLLIRSRSREQVLSSQLARSWLIWCKDRHSKGLCTWMHILCHTEGSSSTQRCEWVTKKRTCLFEPFAAFWAEVVMPTSRWRARRSRRCQFGQRWSPADETSLKSLQCKHRAYL